MYTKQQLTIQLACFVAAFLGAISKSYIHPDENFQGPEVIAGEIFGFPHNRTWEFTSSEPVRSIGPLWIIYGVPMLLLRSLWPENGNGVVAPNVIYNALRIFMFLLNFVLENWALIELLPSMEQRSLALTLVASSYVTWTYQTHTFSNSIETLIVLWSVVIIQRIRGNTHRANKKSSSVLGILLTFGIFNRITFPAFLLVPGCSLLQHFMRWPWSLVTLVSSITAASIVAVGLDSHFYNSAAVTSWGAILGNATLTPINALLYNTSTENLELHGLHPRWHHVVSLCLLLGPGVLLLLNKNTAFRSLPFLSAASGTAILSLIPHQEPRFLLPVVPLLFSSVQLPRSPTLKSVFWTAWIVFNIALAGLMGKYHQGGVIPAQLALGGDKGVELKPIEVLWWRTYSPPVWLLGGSNITTNTTTTDLMGISFDELKQLIDSKVHEQGFDPPLIALVAPNSSVELDQWKSMPADEESGRHFYIRPEWTTGSHLNLDDLDIPTEGLKGTWDRVVGRRGLTIWSIAKCHWMPGEPFVQAQNSDMSYANKEALWKAFFRHQMAIRFDLKEEFGVASVELMKMVIGGQYPSDDDAQGVSSDQTGLATLAGSTKQTDSETQTFGMSYEMALEKAFWRFAYRYAQGQDLEEALKDAKRDLLRMWMSPLYSDGDGAEADWSDPKGSATEEAISAAHAVSMAVSMTPTIPPHMLRQMAQAFRPNSTARDEL